jgi:AraC-like DNA-binding protein
MTEHADPLAECAARGRPAHTSTALVRALVLFATASGLPRAAIDARLGAHAARLDDPEHRVPSALYSALLDDCQAASGDPAFALRLGAATRVGHLGLLGFVMQACATLGESLAAYERWQRTLGESLALTIVRHGGTATLRLLPADAGAARAARIDSMTAAVHAVCAELAGRPLPWRRVALAHLAQDRDGTRARALARLLGLAPGPGPDELAFDAAALDWPVQHGVADPALAALLRTRLAEQHAALCTDSTTRRAEAWLRRHLAQCARPQLPALAEALHCSPRALQSRLQAEGTSFRALADAVAQDAAEAWLRQGQRVAEVAYALGFAEEAAFFRAFRRWTGHTPSAWRALGAAAPPAGAGTGPGAGPGAAPGPAPAAASG